MKKINLVIKNCSECPYCHKKNSSSLCDSKISCSFGEFDLDVEVEGVIPDYCPLDEFYGDKDV